MSVVQTGYREIPCKRCGRPIPLACFEAADGPRQAETRQGSPAAPTKAPASYPMATASATSAHVSTHSYRVPADLAVPAALEPWGEAVACTSCGARIDPTLRSCPLCGAGEEAPSRDEVRPLGAAAIQHQPGAQQQLASCPHCGEEIRDNALKCRFCRKFLADPVTISRQLGFCRLCGLSLAQPGAPCPRCAAPTPAASRRPRVASVLLAILAILAVALLLLWIGWIGASRSDAVLRGSAAFAAQASG